MTIEAEIYTRATGHAGLAALVGTRVYPGLLPPDATLPALAYRRVSARRPSAMGSDTGIVRARFQFDAVVAESAGTSGFDTVRAVAEQVRLAFQRWRTTTGTIVQDTFFENETDLFVDSLALWQTSLDFEINYLE